MWAGQRQLLEGHDVVAPSLYGRGNTIDRWAESLLAELKGPFDLVVGASMGGGAALALERQRPGFVRAVVLAGAHAGPDAPERRPQRAEQIEEWRAKGDEDRVAIVEALRDRPDDRAVVAAFAGPLLVVVGSEDPMITPEAARELAASAPAGRVAVIEGAGHLVSLDAPEVFDETLSDFLEELA